MSEKEISLCLCKLCLNARMLFEPLQTQAKKDGDDIGESISQFFFGYCVCPKLSNDYFQLKCLKGKCKECNATKSLTCRNDESNYVK